MLPQPSRITARRDSTLYFIAVVAAAFAVTISVMVLGTGATRLATTAKASAHAHARAVPAARAALPATTATHAAGPAVAGKLVPEADIAWTEQAWGHMVTGLVDRAAAAWHAEHMRHLAHVERLRHLAYLRQLARYQATGQRAMTASNTAITYPASGAQARVAVNWALHQVGMPYLWGGTGNGGFDCSGLVMSAWAIAGVQLPRTSYAQANAGPRISRSQLRPGDLVFSNGFGHVAMYIGGGQVVQAPAPGGRVEVTALPSDGFVDAYVRVPATERHPSLLTRVSTPSGGLGCAGLETLWDRAGGSQSRARIAASIAMAESSGQQYATGAAGERGYWQINPDHGSLSTYDPLANARAAVILSGNGTDWTAWTTFTSGVYAGRC